jgi:glc operon protein GlcG
MSRNWLPGALVALATAWALPVFAQMPNPYGAPITLETSQKILDAAKNDARRQNLTMAIAITDPAGELVHFEKMDATQTASVNVAIGKARSAALYKRPTKVFQDVLAAGGDGLRVLQLDRVVAVEGGLPLVIDGKIVGAIGVSGGTSAQDGVVAKAGADALAK